MGRCSIALCARCCDFKSCTRADIIKWLTIVAALALLVASFFAISITSTFSEGIADCSNAACDRTRDIAVETSMGGFVVHIFTTMVAFCIISAEYGFSCVAKYVGFLAYRFGRGLALTVCGLIVASYSRTLLHTFEQSGHAPEDSSFVASGCGGAAALVGVLNMLLAMVPACCTSLALPADKITVEFRDTHSQYHNDHTPRKSSSARAAAEPDPEMGECKTPRCKPLSVTKGRRSRTSDSSAAAAADSADMATAQPPADQSAATDNPFIGRTVDHGLPPAVGPNPFYPSVNKDRC